MHVIIRNEQRLSRLLLLRIFFLPSASSAYRLGQSARSLFCHASCPHHKCPSADGNRKKKTVGYSMATELRCRRCLLVTIPVRLRRIYAIVSVYVCVCRLERVFLLSNIEQHVDGLGDQSHIKEKKIFTKFFLLSNGQSICQFRVFL